ncbi:NmrA-like family protein [Cadophora sp. MPI-SDFR-AT-0126]|nr:NmrA-like family protein [Leotiomycetes sp. MPI-SDFR-AT-0126]
MPFLVAVAGVSGRFGRCVVQELLKKPDTLVRGLVRDSSKVPAAIRSSSAFELLEGDVTDDVTLRKLVKGADVVISALLGSDSIMIEAQKQLIDLSEEANVPRFIASDYTLDYTKLEYGQLPSKDPMKKIYEYLRGKSIKGVHVFIGAFLDTFWTQWFGIWNPEEWSLSFWGTGDEIWELTSYENTAEFVAELALDNNATGIQNFVGDRISIRGIAELFEEVHGQKLSLRQLGSLDDLKTVIDSTNTDEDPMTWLPLSVPFFFISSLPNQSCPQSNLC